MVEQELFLQHWMFTRFLLPFLLVFFIIYAVLEKTKILGEDNKQLNALVSFVIGFIFVGLAYPTLIIRNLMLFLAVSLVVVFVLLLIWGFLSKDNDLDILTKTPWLKIVSFIFVVFGVVYATLWAAGIDMEPKLEGVIGFLFMREWSEALWVNAIFIVLIALALALVLKGSKSN